jgi:hypothetical protein
MHGLSDTESEFLDTLSRISDPKLRYFYMMLGEAIAGSCSHPRLEPEAANRPMAAQRSAVSLS